MTAACRSVGAAGPYELVECESFEAKFDLLSDLAWDDARHDAVVAELADELAELGPPLGERLHAWVLEHVPFRPDGKTELYRSPAETIAGGGDCDDAVRLMLATARRLEVPARLLAREGSEGVQGHVALQFDDGQGWQWAETTIAAAYGEAPDTAALRLASERTDVGAALAIRISPEAARVALEAADPAGMVIVDPNGPVGRQRYGEIVRSLYSEIRSDPDVGPSLSALSLAFAEIQRGALEGADRALSERIDAVEAQIEALAQRLADAAIADAAASVVDDIPVVGALVGIAVAIGKAIGFSSGPTASEKIAACQKTIVQPKPSRGGELVPADLLRPETTIANYLALIDQTDLDEAGGMAGMPSFRTLMQAQNAQALLEAGAGLYPNVSQKAALELWIAQRGTLTTAIDRLALFRITKADQARLYLLRRAIASQYRRALTAAEVAGGAQGTPIGTGGVEAWPLYLDLLMAQFRLGRLSWPALATIWGLTDHCYSENEGWRPVKALLDAYAASLEPQYSAPVEGAIADGSIRIRAAEFLGSRDGPSTNFFNVLPAVKAWTRAAQAKRAAAAAGAVVGVAGLASAIASAAGVELVKALARGLR